MPSRTEDYLKAKPFRYWRLQLILTLPAKRLTLSISSPASASIKASGQIETPSAETPADSYEFEETKYPMMLWD
ncbi:MAG: hypothetical protein R3C03_17670 [Pirellulaceae bacterium]